MPSGLSSIDMAATLPLFADLIVDGELSALWVARSSAGFTAAPEAQQI
jgi:hypothetical protein